MTQELSEATQLDARSDLERKVDVPLSVVLRPKDRAEEEKYVFEIMPSSSILGKDGAESILLSLLDYLNGGVSGEYKQYYFVDGRPQKQIKWDMLHLSTFDRVQGIRRFGEDSFRFEYINNTLSRVMIQSSNTDVVKKIVRFCNDPDYLNAWQNYCNESGNPAFNANPQH